VQFRQNTPEMGVVSLTEPEKRVFAGAAKKLRRNSFFVAQH
jgi:hypothetical protein